jgi:uncharacterized protein (TIGR02265 family)
MPDELSIRGSSLKALFDGIKLSHQPQQLEALRELFGLNYHNLPEYYPFDLYTKMLDWLRQEFYPQDAPSDAYEKLGRNITQGFFSGAVGQLLRIGAELIGVEQGLNFFFHTLGGATPLGSFQTLEQRPGYARFVLWNVPQPPEVTCGMILETMQATKIQNSKISYQRLNAKDTEFEVTWTQ